MVAGQFDGGTAPGIGALVRTGGTFGALALLSLEDGGSGFRTIGVLAGPDGRGAVIWWDTQELFIARRSQGGWGAPQVLSATALVVPRFTSIENGARGLIHFSVGNQPLNLEVGADGYVGQPVMATIDGQVSGAQYAATGSKAAAISLRTSADGGLEIIGSQCR